MRKLPALIPSFLPLIALTPALIVKQVTLIPKSLALMTKTLALIVRTLALFSRTLALGGGSAPLRNRTAALGPSTAALIAGTVALGIETVALGYSTHKLGGETAPLLTSTAALVVGQPHWVAQQPHWVAVQLLCGNRVRGTRRESGCAELNRIFARTANSCSVRILYGLVSRRAMPKEETVALYRERILRVLRQIQEQLDRVPSVEELSNVASFSHYRARLEQSSACT